LFQIHFWITLMTYRAPVEMMLFTMRHMADMDANIANGLYADLEDDLASHNGLGSHNGLAQTILEEAAKFANERLAPLNKIGDKQGAEFKDGSVTTPKGWREAYQDWAQAGWNGISAPSEFGGQDLPILLNSACSEMWNAANMAFALNPMLSGGAVEALLAHGTQELQQRYLAKLVSGAWTGTMNLTEPQAGSDLSALRAKAVPQKDGTYLISGTKIYITYGEHECADNIIHLVLARLPDAPHGTRGISLFLVPKFLVNSDGSLGEKNDVRCSGIEHKLGIHASPTCTMIYGDKGGATGWLIGEENKGLACMFTMMNNARLNVGIQGMALANRAYQQALWFAKERKQGKAIGASNMSAIIEHPDVKRMLLEMRSKTSAARAICYVTATALDRAHRLTDIDAKRIAFEEASLLIPVAKSYSTDIGIEVASTGVQVHGGMGYVEETGAAQYVRDARIASIYEGTNGIQAIDLIARKLPQSGGATVKTAIAEYKQIAEKFAQVYPKHGAILENAVVALERATVWMLATYPQYPNDALAGATPYLRLFAHVSGGCYLAKGVLSATKYQDPLLQHALEDAKFFIENDVNAAQGLELAIIEGTDTINNSYLKPNSQIDG
jgi:acyl-CoA dehydrogenase